MISSLFSYLTAFIYEVARFPYWLIYVFLPLDCPVTNLVDFACHHRFEQQQHKFSSD